MFIQNYRIQLQPVQKLNKFGALSFGDHCTEKVHKTGWGGPSKMNTKRNLKCINVSEIMMAVDKIMEKRKEEFVFGNKGNIAREIGRELGLSDLSQSDIGSIRYRIYRWIKKKTQYETKSMRNNYVTPIQSTSNTTPTTVNNVKNGKSNDNEPT